MAGSYRHQTLIAAPIEEVWAVIRDPRTHPEWWPDVVEVRVEEPLVEGGEYIRSSRLLPFLEAVEDVWVAERLQDLKEARFRCTKTGTWARFSLTPAQAETFVELETGMDPTKLRWRLRTPSCSPRVMPAMRGYVRAITRWPRSADTVV